MGPGVLSEILESLPKFQDDRLLVGFDTSDDASVFQLRDDLVSVQTVDFFPPMVDDPYLFGQIAAANALSDIFAMGVMPSVALNLVCFPNCLPLSVLREILAGGYDKVQEAGAVIAGGHSIADDVPKYGLCVTGFAHPQEIWANRGANVGDLLVLTKALGSGILNTAAKADLLRAEEYRPTVETMAALNKHACEAGRRVGLSACTDITGFGLLGHLCEMMEAPSDAIASRVTAQIWANKLPLLPKALEMAEEGIIPQNAYMNRAHFEGRIDMPQDMPLALQDVMYDPQTSGGMLISLPEARAEMLLQLLLEKCADAAIIGKVVPFSGKQVQVV